AGGGVLGAGAWEELRRLAEDLEAPVLMTNNAKGALSDRHYLAHHVRDVWALVPDADVLLAVGTRFAASAGAAGPPAWLDKDKTVIQIDIDPDEVGRNYPPDIGIVADARLALTELVERVERKNRARETRRDELMAIKQAH